MDFNLRTFEKDVWNELSIATEKVWGVEQYLMLKQVSRSLGLDKELEKRGHRFCRCADDCVPRRRTQVCDVAHPV